MAVIQTKKISVAADETAHRQVEYIRRHYGLRSHSAAVRKVLDMVYRSIRRKKAAQ